MLVESENQNVRIDAAIRHAEYYDLQECFDTLYAKAMKRSCRKGTEYPGRETRISTKTG